MKLSIALCLMLVIVSSAFEINNQKQISIKVNPIELFKQLSKNDDSRIICGCCGVNLMCRNSLVNPEILLQTTSKDSTIPDERLSCYCCGYYLSC